MSWAAAVIRRRTSPTRAAAANVLRRQRGRGLLPARRHGRTGRGAARHRGRGDSRSSASTTRPTLRDVYRTDWACNGRSEEWCVERTVRHFLALERMFDELGPGRGHPRGGQRDDSHGGPPGRAGPRRAGPVPLLHDLSPAAAPVRGHHARPDRLPGGPAGADRRGARRGRALHRRVRRPRPADPCLPSHAARRPGGRACWRVTSWSARCGTATTTTCGRCTGSPAQLRERVRAQLVKALYEPLPRDRPFVYFPLHVVDDYKIKRVIPHCANQAALVEQVARALPHGYDLVVKEHPMSIGRNPIALMRRLTAMRNVRARGPARQLARADSLARRRSCDQLHRRAGGAASRQAGADSRRSLLRGHGRHARRGLLLRHP